MAKYERVPTEGDEKTRSATPDAGMVIGFPKEVCEGEHRLAVVPDSVPRLIKFGFEVVVEKGAGMSAGFTDNSFIEVGARIAPTAKDLWAQAQVVVKIQPPTDAEVALLRPRHTLISYIFPSRNQKLLQALKDSGATVLAMDTVPRISRAQKLDSLSSMAKVAGYRAVIEAVNHFGRFCQQEITAAGTLKPAKFLIIGGGVAGLAALGVSRKLGAVVEVFDSRPVVREQVESMGGSFLEVDIEEDGTGSGGYAKVMSAAFIKAEMDLFLAKSKVVDVIITTAAIPGKAAPILITKEMIEAMKTGSVVVDLAAAQGGNCELTQPDQVVNHKGVNIVGIRDMPNRMPNIASQMYSQNILALLQDLGTAKKWNVNLEDVIIRGMCVSHQNEILFPPPVIKMPEEVAKPPPPPPKTKEEIEKEEAAAAKQELYMTVSWQGTALFFMFLIAMWGTFSTDIRESFLPHILVFVLACIAGYCLIWNVADALRTPLMSVTNAISGIVILGGMTMLDTSTLPPMTVFLSALATFVASINAAGGFWVTQRMLQMFKKFGK